MDARPLRLEHHERVPPDVDAALEGLDGITVYHRPAWRRVLARAYGWRVEALVGRDPANRACAFLPFVRKRRLGRIVHVCLPLSHRVGWALHPDLRQPLPAIPPRLRPMEVHEGDIGPGSQPCARHVITELDLRAHASPEALLAGCALTHRRNVRKAATHGVTLRVAAAPEDYLAFAALQAVTRHRQGAPTYPTEMFRAIAEELAPGGQARLHLAELGGKPVAGVLILLDGGVASYCYGASLPDRDVMRLGVNPAVMAHALRTAWMEGRRVFDFGTSPVHQRALIEYKERFGGRTRPMIHSVTTGEMEVAQDGLLVRAASSVLRHTPSPVFQFVSPWLLRAVV